MSRPEISIVIPTRNRPILAQVAIESALDDVDADVEVVVADNGDRDLDVPHDGRVNLLQRPSTPLTMTDNWERALLATRGEWVTFMSDKHRLVPRLYRQVLQRARAAKMLVATFERAVLFQDIPSDSITVQNLWRHGGSLLRPDEPGRAETRSARETMAEWYRIIRGAPHRPQIYRGAIHRSVIEAAMKKGPRFFFGTCPDYASGLQTMGEIENYLATNIPAVVVQVPTSDVSAWSPAQSLDEGGKLGNERIREAGFDSFARYNLPITVTSSILETLLEFRRLRPAACDHVRVDWRRYTWLATNEIESMKLSSRERWHRHALVTRASQREGVDLRSLATQARVIVSRRHPGLSENYRKVKAILQTNDGANQPTAWSWHRSPIGSLVEARVDLAMAFGAPNHLSPSVSR